MISHRLMFISYAHHVVVIEVGVTVEDGPPKELRDSPNGRFAALVSPARTQDRRVTLSRTCHGLRRAD